MAGARQDNGQNASSLRRRMRSAVAHKRLADQMLDSILRSQEQFNLAMDKLDADTAGGLDTDYSNLAISDLFEADGEGTGAQHKASLRDSLRSAVRHRRLADELADSIEEFQAAFNAFLAKLDAEGGTLASTDFVADIGVEVLDSDGEGFDAQHKASLRNTMINAMANKPLANTVMDAISGMQEALNASCAALDAGTVNGGHAGFKVDEIQPD